MLAICMRFWLLTTVVPIVLLMGPICTLVELYNYQQGVFRILITLLAEFARCQTFLN